MNADLNNLDNLDNIKFPFVYEKGKHKNTMTNSESDKVEGQDIEKRQILKDTIESVKIGLQIRMDKILELQKIGNVTDEMTSKITEYSSYKDYLKTLENQLMELG